MKIFYRVSRVRLGQGAIPFTAFLPVLLNCRHAAAAGFACCRIKALDRAQVQPVALSDHSSQSSDANSGAARNEQKQNILSGFDSRMSNLGELRFLKLVFHFFTKSQNRYERCKLLKQLADRNKYKSSEDNSGVVGQTLITKNQRLSLAQLELSESEAKFFLDRNSGTKNIDRKFFGDYSERAKFHLQQFGNLLNWRSYVLGWEGVSSYAQESARLRKAASPKQGLSTRTNYQHQASGKKRLLGFFLFPANMEESDLNYELDFSERGQKGAWSYCVIR